MASIVMNFSEEQQPRALPFDQKTNEDISEGLNVELVDEKQRRYKSNWQRHVTKMNNNNRVPKIMLNCRPNGRRRLGRTLKRLLDETETGLSRYNW